MASLARQLGVRGFFCSIAAPAQKKSDYVHDGLQVHRFSVDSRPIIEHAYGFPDQSAAEGFREIIERVRPQIVHLHARTAAVSHLLVDIAHAHGARVVFTYHTPTVSCARGTLMLHGRIPCDGRIERSRCTACGLTARGVPAPVAALAARIPEFLAERAPTLPAGSRLATACRVPDLIVRGQRLFFDLVGKADHVVAVCRWVADVLTSNGVPASKITISRQGIAETSPKRSRAWVSHPGPLRIAYFGRLDPTKGIDVLVNALAHAPNLRVALDIYAMAGRHADPELAALLSAVQHDTRIRLLSTVEPARVVDTMATYDLVAVPSRGMETGPLVVLEAFAAGVPVIGSKLGGIAELVRDGIDGVLVPPDDVHAWSSELTRLAADSVELPRLAANLPVPRIIDNCAAEMASLYSNLLS